jgi:hypothetical protein
MAGSGGDRPRGDRPVNFWKRISQGNHERWTRHHAALEFVAGTICRAEAPCGVFAEKGEYVTSDVGLQGERRDCKRCFPPAPRAVTVGEVAARAIAELSACTWTEDADGVWWTACGEAHVFTAGGPAENRHRFCAYCGGALRVAARKGE